MRFLLLLPLLVAAPALAQDAPGVVVGTVVWEDSTGTVRPAPHVSVRPRGHAAIHAVRSPTDRHYTDRDGRFVVTAPSGDRLFVIESEYFEEGRTTIAVPVGDTVRVRLTLRLRAFYRPPPPLEPEDPDWLELYGKADEMEATARAFGIPAIRTTSIPEGHREAWIWANADRLYRFVRLVDDGQTVRGEVFAYWLLPEEGEARMDRLTDLVPCDADSARPGLFVSAPDSSYGYIRHGNDAEGRRTQRFIPAPAGVEACRLRLDPAPDWTALLRELEAHDVWSLPDDSAFPLDHTGSITITTGGWDLAALTRQGPTFRAYSYFNPDPLHPVWVQERHAHAIGAALKQAGLLLQRVPLDD